MSGSQQLLLGGIPTVTPVDPYFYSVTSLLHGDGVNGGQNNTFLDSSTNNFTITRNGNTTQGSFSPFSQTGWSNYFDGSGDWLNAGAQTAYDFGTGDFTVETWVYGTATTWTGGDAGGATVLFDTRDQSNSTEANRFTVGILSSGSYPWFYNAGSNVRTDSSIPALVGVWNHIAWTRASGTVKIWVNGFQGASFTDTTSFSVARLGIAAGAAVSGGTNNRSNLIGYLSNARWVKGTAVYTSNFTPSTTPLTAISGTSLLTCQANRFLDASSNNFTITRNGDVSVQPFSPFNPITPYSTSAVGGSGYFDGSGDYLGCGSQSAYAFGTGDFTVEAWIYPTAFNAYNTFVATRPSTSGVTDAWTFTVSSAGQLILYSSGNIVTSASGVVPLNAWTHVAVTRSGTTVKCYVNGTQSGSNGTNSQDFSYTTLAVGANSAGATELFTGYICGVRLLKGTALTSFTITTPLTVITNTSLLLNFTNGAIFDNAAVADYETVGNAQISTSVKKYGTGSMAFDGTGDYLVTAAKPTMTLGTGDFTVEFWMYANTPQPSTRTALLSFGNGFTTNVWAIQLNNTSPSISNQINVWAYNLNSGAVWLQGGPTIVASTWYHIAVCRNGSTFKLFVNGTQAATATSTASIDGNSTTLQWQVAYNSPDYFNGYIDDIRITKGIARYNYNFTPPTAEFPNIGGTVTLTADPYFDYTTLLLPGNGTNGAQNNTFLDSSTNAFSITRNGNTTQGTFSPFSQTGWGNYFDASGDYLTIASNTAFALPGDFTLEMWVYPSTITGALFGIGDYRAGNNGFSLYYFSSKLRLYVNGADVLVSASDIPLNTWLHFAVVRSGSGSNNLKLYINGTQQAQATNTVSFTGVSGNGASVNNDYGGSFAGTVPSGYLSNVRLVKGTAVYTADFTPPTAPLTAISGTSLLTCQSNRFIDNSTNNFAITRNGDVSVQAFSPFNPTAAWSAATNGGSGYFDGSGDYLSVADAAAFTLGTSDFCMESWVYPTNASTGASESILGQWSSASYGWIFQYRSNALLMYYSTNGSSTTNAINASATVVNNAWNHIAFVRSGNTLSAYVNGTRVSTNASFTASIVNSSSTVNVGRNGDNSEYVTGYLNGTRLVVGSSVYDPSQSSITVPTSPPTAITNTSLLLNFTNAGIYDATSKNDLETVGNTQISTTQSKFGGSSMYFDGSGDYIPFILGQNLNFGTGDFTFETWVRFSSVVGGLIIGKASSAGNISGGFTLYLSASGTLRVYGPSVSGTVTKTGITANTWYHVAVTRYGNTFTLWVDGISAGTFSDSGTINNTDGNSLWGIGNWPLYLSGTYLYGYLQDFRLTKGIARYTSNFTPPTTAFLTL